MAKLYVDWNMLQALQLLANNYCTTRPTKWVRINGVDTPASDIEIGSNSFVSKWGYEVLAELLDVPCGYLVASRYPNKDYTLDKRVMLPRVGSVRFIIYGTRQAPNGAAFLRFYVECPACGKEYPVSRMHQHIMVHQKLATLVDTKIYNTGMLEFKYLLKRAYRYHGSYGSYTKYIIMSEFVGTYSHTYVNAASKVGWDSLAQLPYDAKNKQEALENFLKNAWETDK